MRWKRQYRYFILPLQNNRWSPLLCFLLNEWPAARRTSPPVTSTKQPPHHLDYSFLPIFFCWLFLPIIICHVIHSYLFRYNAAIGCLTIIVIIVNILATAFGGPDNDCTPNVSALEWKAGSPTDMYLDPGASGLGNLTRGEERFCPTMTTPMNFEETWIWNGLFTKTKVDESKLELESRIFESLFQRRPCKAP